MDASDKQAAEMMATAVELLAEDDEDWALPIREEELHALVRAHEHLDEIQNAIEKELTYRVDHDDKIAAGDAEDRAYAEQLG